LWRAVVALDVFFEARAEFSIFMLTWFAKNVRNLYRVLNTHDSPRQMALGVAFGVLLGLIPKGNLLAIGLAALFFTLRVNLNLGLLAAAVVSFVAGLSDPVAHRAGLWLLESSALRPLWVWLINVPFAPWTRFNNTVVLGNLVLGLLLFYPVYRAALPGCARWRRYLDQRSSRRMHGQRFCRLCRNVRC
jgi:uncharacterized protein (TIGR03546 family)